MPSNSCSILLPPLNEGHIEGRREGKAIGAVPQKEGECQHDSWYDTAPGANPAQRQTRDLQV